MDLTQLRMFCSVAEIGSFACAAVQLHRVPSNFSTRLRQLAQGWLPSCLSVKNNACACR